MEETDKIVHDLLREAELRREGHEEWAEVSGLLATQVCGATQAWAAPKGLSGCVALSQLWYVLMSVAPVIPEGQEDRAAQTWSCPLLVAAPSHASCLGSKTELTLLVGTWASWP